MTDHPDDKTALAATEAVDLIDKRLADLREANEIFRKHRWDRSGDIQRNDREIRWLIDLRTIISNPSPNAVTGSSGTHPVPEGAADNAPPAIRSAPDIARLTLSERN
jgi:hypothetical protein